MISFADVLMPVLRSFDPEVAHGFALFGLRLGFGPRQGKPDDSILATEVWGRKFSNPVGIAAGFDKNAEAVRPLYRAGFGFVEIGSVCPRPQPGNPKPRLFRLTEDRAVINRMGFNSKGLSYAHKRLAALHRGALPGPLGVNLGKNKTSQDAAADYAETARALAPFADYLVINVSSPNTPGLRALQGREELETLIRAVRRAAADSLPEGSHIPLLVKIAPDLTSEDCKDVAAVAHNEKLDGLIVSNTTIARPDSLKSNLAGEVGGLSGAPLFEPSTRLLGEMYKLTDGKIPLVGVGGISSGRQAYMKIRAGASLVQLYSALVYEGPGLLLRIKRELAECLRKDGFSSVAGAVGADHL